MVVKLIWLMEKLWTSSINSVRHLQILYFSKKIKKLKRFKKKQKKSALEPLLSYTTPIL